MTPLVNWWTDAEKSATWLIMGKGPSFEARGDYDLSGFRVISLNHIVREMPVEIAHMIDLDVLRDCAEAIENNARFLLMPRVPHSKGAPQSKTLDELKTEFPILERLGRQKRLLWYNLAQSPGVPELSPWQYKKQNKSKQSTPTAESFVVPMGHFSGEVVTTILGMLGAKKIRTLGLDGGQKYAAQFSDLDKTRLDNGHENFDVQAHGIADAIQRYDLDYGPLNSETPMRFFIGTDESQLLGAKLLEYSIRKHSTITSTFDDMMHVESPMPQNPANRPRTNFSFNRFASPALAGHQGRAVYVDADMQVFRDARDLWDTSFGDAKVLHAPSSSPTRPFQLSVLLMDCSRLDWTLDKIVADLDSEKLTYDSLMKEFKLEPEGALKPGLTTDWNSLEEYHAGRTGLIHYTDMHTQPWVFGRNPNGDEWVGYLKSALREEFVSWDDLKAAQSKGYLRPSLMWQLKLPRKVWPIFNRTFGRILDRGFKAHQATFVRVQSDRAQATAAVAT